MRSSIQRLVASIGALAVALTGAVFVTAAPASASPVVTDYGLQSIAFGTRVISNNVSLNTGRTALAWIACTRLAGVNPDNHTNAGNYLAEAGAPTNNPWVSLGAVTSRNWSFRKADKGIVGISATNRIASISLSGPSPAEGVAGPLFQLEGLSTKATAYAQRGVLKGDTQVTSKSLSLTLPEGTPIDQELADLLGAVQEGIGAVTDVLELQQDQAIEIPGLGVLRLGYERVEEHKSYASAAAFTLLVDMAGADGTMNTDDDSTVQIGRSRARINRNLPAGIMNGFGYALELSAADGLLNIGRAGMQVLPCQGTNGEVRGVQVPAQDVLDGALDLGSMHGLVYGLQNRDGTGAAWTKGKVAEIGLGSGDERVVLRGIVGVATVRKKASGTIVRSIKGSGVGSMTVGGEEQAVPTGGAPMELPGLGTIQFNITDKSSRGISVTAVRIILNPGETSETVINLGNARTRIKQA